MEDVRRPLGDLSKRAERRSVVSLCLGLTIRHSWNDPSGRGAKETWWIFSVWR